MHVCSLVKQGCAKFHLKCSVLGDGVSTIDRRDTTQNGKQIIFSSAVFAGVIGDGRPEMQRRLGTFLDL